MAAADSASANALPTLEDDIRGALRHAAIGVAAGAAALIVHDTAGASYGWDVVKNSWAGPQYDLPAKDDPEKRIPLQGWLSAEAARQESATAARDVRNMEKDPPGSGMAGLMENGAT